MTPIEITNLTFSWPGAATPVLKQATLSVSPGERVLLRGPSGSGKSTLLSAIAGVVDVPAGTVRIAGTDMGSLRARQRDRFRVDHMGLVFQVFNLIPWLSARENILLPCRFSARRRQHLKGEADAAANQLMANLGVDPDTAGAVKASELSVGQQQRVAAARALIGSPEIVIADEPTSALDPDAKNVFMQLLSAQAKDTGAALLVVSHDAGLEHHFDRVIDLADLQNGEVLP